MVRFDSLLRLSLLGILCGLLSGFVMLVFRAGVETAQAAFLPGGNPENFEGLAPTLRVLLPVAGAALLGVLFLKLGARDREVGPAHVIDRLGSHAGRLPLVNALVQFAGGALCIIAGESVGREGPAIHLGAASGSLAGQRFGLAPADLRVLVACGVAAAIAAGFNTPLAGVVFAMEVVVKEYSVVGFAPVILAAVSATALTRLVFGPDPAFVVPVMSLRSLWELPYILCVGIAIGVLASLFIILVEFFALRASRMPYWLGVTLGGVVVGLCALPTPQIMGIGYDTVGAALLGQLTLMALVGIVAFKLLATTAGVGLGLPGGLIGPMLVIGAAAGGALGIVGASIAPQYASSSAFYALIGMGAMMAGTLHAPLAALTAMLELTGNPNIIWPGMLAAIAAFGTSRELFRRQPVFETLLSAQRGRSNIGAPE